jgi:hypothetical protein
MANEIAVTTSLLMSKGGVTENKVWSTTVDMAGTNYNATVASIATTITNVPLGAVATNGYVAIRNLDTTNYVQWGKNVSGTLAVVGKLMPNSPPAVFQLDPSITFAMQAHTGACNVEIFLIEA